jgi:hypothetical protein
MRIKLFFIFVFLNLFSIAYAQDNYLTSDDYEDEYVVVDGIKYGYCRYHHWNGTTNAMVVKGDQPYSGELTIPETITFQYGNSTVTLKVIGISDKAFVDCLNLTAVSIPASVFFINRWFFVSEDDLYYYMHDMFCPDDGGEPVDPFKGCVNLASIKVDNNNKTFKSGEDNNLLMYGGCIISACQAAYFRLTYYVDNEIYKEYKHKCGEDITPETEPDSNKEGYSFSGWSNIPQTMPAGNVRINGYFKANKHDLVYEVDGKMYKTFEVAYGTNIDAIEEPTKEGYTFSGWSQIPETMPDHDVTVTGTFSPNVYKLSYMVDEEEYKVVEVKCDETITAEPEPTRKGMTFSGWSEIPETMPAKDVEVTSTFSWSKSTIDNVVYQVADTIYNCCSVIETDITGGSVAIASFVDFDETYKVTTIADKVFYGRSGITKIELPATIASIGDRAFASIDELTDVTILAVDIPETDRTAFENSYTDDYVTLHVPASALEKYQAAAPWKNFKQIVAMSVEEDQSNEAIKISSAGQTTYCCEFDLDFKDVEGVKAYTATGYDRISGTIWLTRVFQVPANTGILIMGKQGTYNIPRKDTGTYYANLMVGTLNAITINENDGDYTNYYLSNGTYGVGFYKVNGTQDIGAHRAYLPLLKGTTQAGTRFIGVSFGDEDGTTGIYDAIRSEKKVDDIWYNLQGQRVDKPKRGLYIRNGRKVVVR